MLEQAVCKYLVETITRVEDEAEATGLGRLISFCILINWNVWPAVGRDRELERAAWLS